MLFDFQAGALSHVPNMLEYTYIMLLQNRSEHDLQTEADRQSKSQMICATASARRLPC